MRKHPVTPEITVTESRLMHYTIQDFKRKKRRLKIQPSLRAERERFELSEP